jgi:hypothetical protein
MPSKYLMFMLIQTVNLNEKKRQIYIYFFLFYLIEENSIATNFSTDAFITGEWNLFL